MRTDIQTCVNTFSKRTEIDLRSFQIGSMLQRSKRYRLCFPYLQYTNFLYFDLYSFPYIVIEMDFVDTVIGNLA